MSCQHYDGENRNRNRVPVEQAHMPTHIEVRKKCHREIPLGIKWNAARNIARGRAKKNSEKKIGKNEIEVPIRLPKAIVDVSTDFERDTAQNQTPQNQKEGEIVTGKSRSHQAREDRDQCSAETYKPNFVPRPEWSDRSNHLPSFLGRSRDEPVKHPGAKVSAIENDVDNQH